MISIPHLLLHIALFSVLFLSVCFSPNLVPRVFSLFKMAAAREKTLAHSRSRVSNEDGDVFKMAAAAKRVRRTGYEMLR